MSRYNQMVNKTAKLNINPAQSSNIPRTGMTHTTLIIPSNTVPTFGSYFTININNTGLKVHDLVLQFNINQITGLTGTAAGYPQLSPATFWYTRIEYLVNGVIVDTIYGDETHLLNNICVSTVAERDYNNPTQRNGLSTNNGSNWFVPLKTFFNASHYPILNPSHTVQLKIYMNNLPNICQQSTLTGTPSCTINFCNLIVRGTMLSQTYQTALLNEIQTTPKTYKYYSTLYYTNTYQAGISSLQSTLSSITGSISHLFFVIRPTTGLTLGSQWQYLPILNFQLLSAASASLVGGQALNGNYNLLVQSGKYWFPYSQFFEDSFSTTNYIPSLVYCYSFSADPNMAYQTGQYLTTYNFTGNEQLQVQFNVPTSNAIQLDLYAFQESAINQSLTGIQKLTITE